MARQARGGAGASNYTAKLLEKVIAVLFILNFVIIAVNLPDMLAAIKTLATSEITALIVVEVIIFLIIVLTAKQMVAITGHFLE